MAYYSIRKKFCMFLLFSLVAECKTSRVFLFWFQAAIQNFGFSFFFIPCYPMHYKLDEICFHLDPAESSAIAQKTCAKLHAFCTCVQCLEACTKMAIALTCFLFAFLYSLKVSFSVMA